MRMSTLTPPPWDSAGMSRFIGSSFHALLADHRDLIHKTGLSAAVLPQSCTFA
jgi:hypothetical protein